MCFYFRPVLESECYIVGACDRIIPINHCCGKAELHRVIDTYAPHGSFILGNMHVVGENPQDTPERNARLAKEALRLCRDYYVK